MAGFVERMFLCGLWALACRRLPYKDSRVEEVKGYLGTVLPFSRLEAASFGFWLFQ